MSSPDPALGLRLLCGGAAFFPALIEAIDAAQRSIALETYLFDFQASGEHVAQALVRAAERGVTVRVLVDGAGTGALPAHWVDRFNQAGVQHRVFAPLNFWSVFGFWQPSRWRRLHRKP